MNETQQRINKRRAIYKELQGLLAFLVVFALIAGVGANLITATTVLSNQHNNRVTLSSVQQDQQNSNQILAIIEDCLNPNGKCGKASAASTKHALVQIEQIVVLAAFCARSPQTETVQQIQGCVDGLLK